MKRISHIILSPVSWFWVNLITSKTIKNALTFFTSFKISIKEETVLCLIFTSFTPILLKRLNYYPLLSKTSPS